MRLLRTPRLLRAQAPTIVVRHIYWMSVTLSLLAHYYDYDPLLRRHSQIYHTQAKAAAPKATLLLVVFKG